MSAGDTQSAWTSEDEATYQDMVNRRARFEQNSHEKLTRVAAEIPLNATYSIPDLVAGLKFKAAQLVDALLPYAHGQIRGD